MLRKLGKTVREKLDHVESRLSSRESASTDQPGSNLVSRRGGTHLPSADFPTQADFFRFRKQRGVNLGASPGFPIRYDSHLNCFQAHGLCWRSGLQIARFGKLALRVKVIST